MSDRLNTGPEYVRAVEGCMHEASDQETGTLARLEVYAEALVNATMAQTAILATIAETMGDYAPYEMDTWRDVIPRPPLKECRSKDARRPACAERHTEDCTYAEPPPEPPHELLPIGTRVLVSETAVKHPDGRIVYSKQPKVAKIVGYDLGHSKYQLNDEKFGGGYYDFVTWAFADNRVQPHPEQDGAMAEPTGPRIYVQRKRDGKQGHIVGEPRRNGQSDTKVQVQWYAPGAQPVWVLAERLEIIPADEVDRCPNGQTGDECGEGENRCERCLADEDAEAEAIEGSMSG